MIYIKFIVFFIDAWAPLKKRQNIHPLKPGFELRILCKKNHKAPALLSELSHFLNLKFALVPNTVARLITLFWPLSFALARTFLILDKYLLQLLTLQKCWNQYLTGLVTCQMQATSIPTINANHHNLSQPLLCPPMKPEKRLINYMNPAGMFRI